MSKATRSVSEPELTGTNIASDDAALVKRCRKGDDAAWDELVEKYQRLIYAIPMRAGLSAEQAADVFQDVFITLVEKLDEIKEPDKIRSWIVTTAKYKTWAVIRGEKGRHEPVDEEQKEYETANIRDPQPLADDALVELEEQHLVRNGLAKLDERCRKILAMLYFGDGATYADVAAEIGVGETSISPMRSRCLKKLEKILFR